MARANFYYKVPVRMNIRRVDPRIIISIGVLFTSFSAIFIRLSQAPALAIAANRMILTTIMLIPLLAHERATTKGKRQRVGTRLILLCLLSGFFLAIHFAAWVRSVELTTIASATVIVNSQPLFVVFASFLLFKERVSRRALLYILIVLIGGALLSSGDISLGKDALAGDALALLGAVAVAGYMIIGRYVRQYLSARSYVFIVYGTSAVILSIFCVSTGTPIFDYGYREYLLFAAMAFFCTILGHTLFNWALKYLKASFVSTITLGEPVFATVLGMSIFAEVPPALTVIGGVIMLSGLGAFVREESKTVSSENFDSKAKTWDADPKRTARSRAISDAIRRTTSLQPDFRVMDYGAGTGQLSFAIADSVESVLAVDTSKGMLEELDTKRENAPFGNRIATLCHDLSATPFSDDEFNVIFSAMTFHHVENVTQLLANFYQLLTSGGMIAIADLESEDGSFHDSSTHIHHRGFEPEKLANLARDAGFSDIHTERVHEIERTRDGVSRTFGIFLLTAIKE